MNSGRRDVRYRWTFWLDEVDLSNAAALGLPMTGCARMVAGVKGWLARELPLQARGPPKADAVALADRKHSARRAALAHNHRPAHHSGVEALLLGTRGLSFKLALLPRHIVEQRQQAALAHEGGEALACR